MIGLLYLSWNKFSKPKAVLDFGFTCLFFILLENSYFIFIERSDWIFDSCFFYFFRVFLWDCILFLRVLLLRWFIINRWLLYWVYNFDYIINLSIILSQPFVQVKRVQYTIHLMN